MAEHPWGNSTLIGKCVICYDSYMIRYIIRYIISYMIPYMIRYNIPYTIPPPTVDSKRDLQTICKAPLDVLLLSKYPSFLEHVALICTSMAGQKLFRRSSPANATFPPLDP
jgi:hypothetical protein